MASLIPQTDLGRSGIIFAYLAVRPRSNATPDMSVEYVKSGVGNLPAKIRAKNDSASAADGEKLKWRVLVGFFTHISNWKRKIKPRWAQQIDWELALLHGIRLALKFGADNAVYVSSEAQSDPHSPLLRTLQWFMSRENNIEKNNQMFWKIILSTSYSLAQLKDILINRYPVA